MYNGLKMLYLFSWNNKCTINLRLNLFQLQQFSLYDYETKVMHLKVIIWYRNNQHQILNKKRFNQKITPLKIFAKGEKLNYAI